MWSSISPWAGGLPRRFCCIGGLALAPGLAWQSEARCYALTCLGASWVNPERNASPILNRPEAHVQNDRWAFRSPHRPTIVTTESIRRRTREPGGGLIVLPCAPITVHVPQIVELTARYRLPAVYPFRTYQVGLRYHQLSRQNPRTLGIAGCITDPSIHPTLFRASRRSCTLCVVPG